MTMAYEDIEVERIPLGVDDACLGLVRFNRPEAMNPVGWSAIREIAAAVRALDADPLVRVIAFTGKGKAFSAGGDLKKYIALQRNDADFRGFLNDWHATMNALQFEVLKPVVALVNGVSAAGGTEILLACDFAYMTRAARIGDAHLNFGQMGGGGVLTRLPRKVFENAARELMFSADWLDPEDCLRIGLVNRVFESDAAMMDAALRFARSVAGKSALAVSRMKEVANRGREMAFADSIAYEIDTTHHYCLNSHDSNEGLMAFSEKRAPRFRGA